MKGGRIQKLILIDKSRLELNKNGLVQVITRVFSVFRAEFVDPRLQMAPSKSLKLVSSCPKIDFTAKLS
jgi:hypothetical protein